MADYEPWTYWSAGTCTSSTADSIYEYWCDTGTASTIGCSNNIWYGWITLVGTSVTSDIYQAYHQAPETAEQRQQRVEQEQQRERERQAAVAVELKQREEAVAKAERLLLESLRDKQREEYQEFKRFTVISKDGQRTYRVNKGRSRNVQLVDQAGKVLRTYCAHPAEYVPDQDTMLTQKLMLEHQEDVFLKVANVS